MDVLVALAISIGILIAGWTYVALGVAALPVWAGIVAWGCFFAAGGKTTGLTKTIASTSLELSGRFCVVGVASIRRGRTGALCPGWAGGFLYGTASQDPGARRSSRAPSSVRQPR